MEPWQQFMQEGGQLYVEWFCKRAASSFIFWEANKLIGAGRSKMPSNEDKSRSYNLDNTHITSIRGAFLENQDELVNLIYTENVGKTQGAEIIVFIPSVPDYDIVQHKTK